MFLIHKRNFFFFFKSKRLNHTYFNNKFASKLAYIFAVLWIGACSDQALSETRLTENNISVNELNRKLQFRHKRMLAIFPM